MIPIARPQMGEDEKRRVTDAEVTTVIGAVNETAAELGPLEAATAR